MHRETKPVMQVAGFSFLLNISQFATWRVFNFYRETKNLFSTIFYKRKKVKLLFGYNGLLFKIVVIVKPLVICVKT